MSKTKTVYVCQQCGSQSGKWAGKCAACGNWNSIVEEAAPTAPSHQKGGGEFYTLSSDSALPLPELTTAPLARLTSGILELDRVLGGGFVPGSLVLLGGDPGIGKSTLVLQALNALAKPNQPVLYASGEESAEQIKLRADRLGAQSPHLFVMTENNLERILAETKRVRPALLVVDSIQTVFLPFLESAPGSVAQVRECAGKLLYFSKSSGIATGLVGHVTKEGALAGPRMLEHMVDTVLYFEGDKGHGARILRAVKNRYGATNEIGVFEMAREGLIPVDNPSRLFLAERPEGAAGSAVTAALEGSRPILVEIQALVAGSGLANPRRTAIGLDSGRIALLVAVLERVIGLSLYDQDLYVNVAGGFKIGEPASDLAVLAAIVGSRKNRPIDPRTLIVGEVGLSGEIRSVSQLDTRLKEGAKLGFTRALIPAIPRNGSKKSAFEAPAGMELLPAQRVAEALELLF